jgi:hypothetical protein
MTDFSSELDASWTVLRALIGMGQLPTFLRESAKRSGCRALAAVGSTDTTEAGFHSGQAVEHLCKFIISQRHPTLLAKANDQKSFAFLNGDGHAEADTLADVFTIGLPQVVRLTYGEFGIGDPSQEDLDLVLLARNAAVHIGYGDDDHSIGAVAGMVRLCEPVLSAQGRTVSEWLDDSRLGPVVDAVRTLPRSGVRLSDGYRDASILARIWVAQRAWDRLCGRMPEDQRRLLAVQPMDLSGDWEATLRPCPAGGHMAWFKTELDESDTQNHTFGSGYRDMVQSVGGVDCPLCGLSLDGSDVEILGLRDQIGYDTWGPEGPE